MLSRLGGDRLQRTKRQSHSEWKAGRREAAEEGRQQREMRRGMLQKVKEATEQWISMMRQGPEPMPRSKVKCRRMVGGMRKKKEGRGKWSVEQEEPRSLQAARRVLSAVPLLYVVCTQAMLLGVEAAVPAMAATAASGAGASVIAGLQGWQQRRSRAKLKQWQHWRQEGAVKARAAAVRDARLHRVTGHAAVVEVGFGPAHQSKSLPQMQLLLKGVGPDAKTITIEVGEHATVGDANNAIQEKTGVPAETQMLKHGCYRLEAGHTLKSYNIKEGSTLYLISNGPGGMETSMETYNTQASP